MADGAAKTLGKGLTCMTVEMNEGSQALYEEPCAEPTGATVQRGTRLGQPGSLGVEARKSPHWSAGNVVLAT